MNNLKKKFVITKIVNGIMKMLTVISGGAALCLAGGIAEGTLPIMLSLLAIAGLLYIARDCMNYVIELEDLLERQEDAIKKHEQELENLEMFMERLRRITYIELSMSEKEQEEFIKELNRIGTYEVCRK
ncbi:MAG: hypothetical protein K6G84_00910 [Lachnospiraceae bacterium]|nr:hypothetical protein [Lachnospiraceae bacterium]